MMETRTKRIYRQLGKQNAFQSTIKLKGQGIICPATHEKATPTIV